MIALYASRPWIVICGTATITLEREKVGASKLSRAYGGCCVVLDSPEQVNRAKVACTAMYGQSCREAATNDDIRALSRTHLRPPSLIMHAPLLFFSLLTRFQFDNFSSLFFFRGHAMILSKIKIHLSIFYLNEQRQYYIL